jgi:hypothetical protein
MRVVFTPSRRRAFCDAAILHREGKEKNMRGLGLLVLLADLARLGRMAAPPMRLGHAPVMKARLARPQALLFDADGTLLDSLPPHISFCQTMNDELGLGLQLPNRDDIAACRRVAAAVSGRIFERNAKMCSNVSTHRRVFPTRPPSMPAIASHRVLAAHGQLFQNRGVP